MPFLTGPIVIPVRVFENYNGDERVIFPLDESGASVLHRHPRGFNAITTTPRRAIARMKAFGWDSKYKAV